MIGEIPAWLYSVRQDSQIFLEVDLEGNKVAEAGNQVPGNLATQEKKGGEDTGPEAMYIHSYIAIVPNL